MNESEYAATLLDYLCDARSYAADKGRKTLAMIATVANAEELALRANAEELALRAKVNPLAPTRGL